MSNPSAYIKDPVERKRFTFDYSKWMDEGELLAGLAVLINPATPPYPLVADGAFIDPGGMKLSLYLSEGTSKYLYEVSLIVTTSQGQVKRDDVQIQVI